MSKKTPTENKANAVNYKKYVGIAAQMAGTIVLGVLLGQFLDSFLETDQPVWTGICALLFTIVAMYLVLKDFIKP